MTSKCTNQITLKESTCSLFQWRILVDSYVSYGKQITLISVQKLIKLLKHSFVSLISTKLYTVG